MSTTSQALTETKASHEGAILKRLPITLLKTIALFLNTSDFLTLLKSAKDNKRLDNDDDHSQFIWTQLCSRTFIQLPPGERAKDVYIRFISKYDLVKAFYNRLQCYIRVEHDNFHHKHWDFDEGLTELRNYFEQNKQDQPVKLIDEQIMSDAKFTRKWIEEIAFPFIANRWAKRLAAIRNGVELKEETDKPSTLDLELGRAYNAYRPTGERVQYYEMRFRSDLSKQLEKGKITRQEADYRIASRHLQSTNVMNVVMFKYYLDLLDKDKQLSPIDKKRMRYRMEARINFYIPGMCLDVCNASLNYSMMELIRENLDRILPLFIEHSQVNAASSRNISFIKKWELYPTPREKSISLLKYLEEQANQFREKQVVKVTLPVTFSAGAAGVSAGSAAGTGVVAKDEAVIKPSAP